MYAVVEDYDENEAKLLLVPKILYISSDIDSDSNCVTFVSLKCHHFPSSRLLMYAK